MGQKVRLFLLCNVTFFLHMLQNFPICHLKGLSKAFRNIWCKKYVFTILIVTHPGWARIKFHKMFPNIQQWIWVRKCILFIYRIICLLNHIWDLFEKTPFSIFWRPKFGQKAGISSIYATITIVGYRYGDSRVVQIQRYSDLSNIFRLKNPQILTFSGPTWYF